MLLFWGVLLENNLTYKHLETLRKSLLTGAMGLVGTYFNWQALTAFVRKEQDITMLKISKVKIKYPGSSGEKEEIQVKT